MRTNSALSSLRSVLSCLLIVFALAGCKDKAEGPKRTDDEAAHHPHYHPDVHRSTITGSRPAEEVVASRPAATQFADLFESGVVGSPVMFVNNQPLSIAEILEPLIEPFRRQSKVLSDRDYTESVLRDLRDQIDYQVSTMLVYEEAKTHYSDKRMQEAFDKRIDQVIGDIVNVQYGGIRARYEAHLKALDYTPTEAKERLKREAIVREYLRERFRPMLREPTRHELSRYYEENLAGFTSLEKVELFLIEVPVASVLEKPMMDATSSEIDAARAKARTQIRLAHEEIDKGADFGEVAKKYSRGASAQQGGAWGEINRGSLTKRWAAPGEIVFNLKQDEMKEVETDEAMFLVKAGKKTPSQRVSFEEAQKTIIEKLTDEQFNKMRTDYIRELIRNSTIRKRPEFTQALLAVVPRPQRSEPKEPSLLKPGG